jgi:predicted ABC-type ATPase
MIVVAGPNGAGKSTLYQWRVALDFPHPFVNADIIQRDELLDLSLAASYTAARIADEQRAQYIAARTDFATETVFSHESKLALIDTAKAAGFRVVVMHVGVDDADISVERVNARVDEGGHPVPEDKIRTRYERNVPLIREAILRADIGLVYDNSPLNSKPKLRLTFDDGHLIKKAAKLPKWISAAYKEDLAR